MAERVEGYAAVAAREAPELNRPLDADLLDAIITPVLLIQGTRSADRYKQATSHLAERLDAHVVDVEAGHLGPLTAGPAVAKELVQFLSGP
jgi:pimeloyl-ACP methyl ester carboxylesterase